MRSETAQVHTQTGRTNVVRRKNNHVAQKLRGAAVMYGPAVVWHLFEGASLLVMVLGGLKGTPGSRAASVLRSVAAVGTLSPWAYLLIARPWHMRWGTTDEEVRKRLPGDDLVPHPALESTRAVTIHAPAGKVWSWLVQLGQNRGGFYSYDRLENLAGADIHNVDRIVPEMQHLKVGDFVPMAPVEWGVPMGGCDFIMEHRTHALSPGSRRKFALYWWLMIKAGSAFLSRLLLRTVKRRAERAEDHIAAGQGPGHATPRERKRA